MDRIYITRRHNGNWIINLCVILCNLNIIISKSYNPNNDTVTRSSQLRLPKNWPSNWNSGEIPYVFNFYSIGVKRLISLVKKGHNYIENRSCLKFKEYYPKYASSQSNLTVLYYNFSGVLEKVAHATLHGMGLLHEHREPFIEADVRDFLFQNL
ncbi:hypothetical protein SFRURICE_017057 [Spodoptera frugiperda]|nr:hypothetical protein SFRURICE_017057 [Spodoptera frugiperda]